MSTVAQIVVHKELINNMPFKIMIFRHLTLNDRVMWTSVEFCGILFYPFFGQI
jgi:hypothetical protein